MIDDLGYKNAVLYCLDVKTFMDSNGDGVGDFEGLSRRMGYLAGMGVTAVWLLPFHPSPKRDNGYDITDHYGVDPSMGSLGDFVNFTHEAKKHGIRVLMDLVVNHTSDQHPWFKEAVADPKSRFRDYYVWSAKRPRDADEGMVFPGVQSSTWTYHARARAFYFHRFYDFQPDLNMSNPEVRTEVQRIAGYWLQLGVSGFRMDAVPFVIQREGAMATGGGWSSPTACSSRSPARRSSATATRSAWATTCRSRSARRCGRRCSGPPSPMPASRRRRSPSSRSSTPGRSGSSASTSPPSGGTPARCSTGPSASSAPARSARRWAGAPGAW